MVVVALLCCMLAPSNAFAAVEDYETALMNPEQLYQYEYEPVYVEDNTVRSAPVLGQDASTVDWVNNTLDAFNSVPWYSSTRYDLFTSVKTLLGGNANYQALVLAVPIGIIFLYWSVRKGVRMLVTAWKKGRMRV